jgi:hypothetical protein
LEKVCIKLENIILKKLATWSPWTFKKSRQFFKGGMKCHRSTHITVMRGSATSSANAINLKNNKIGALKNHSTSKYNFDMIYNFDFPRFNRK